MKISRPLTLFLFAAATVITCGLVLCVRPNSGGTETGDVKVGGVLYNADNSRAAHATVSLIPSNFNPGDGGGLVTADSVTTTDDTGGYRFRTMPADTYNLVCSGSGNLAFRDSLVVKPDSNLIAPACTLRAPGSLSGKVLLQGTDRPTTVMIIVFGTNAWTAPRDSTGAFTLANLAAGRYHVRFLSYLDTYLPLDTMLTIRAGKSDTLAAPIELTYTGIPVPTGLRIQYDTNMRIATLSWNLPVFRTHVAGYNIYREDLDSSDFVKVKGGVTDTVYSDSTGVQDHTYQYRVMAQDTNGFEGGRSGGVDVAFVSAFALQNTISMGRIMPYRLGVSKDSMIFVAFYSGDAIIKEYNRMGDSINAFGKGQSTEPWGVAVNSVGSVFVADLGGQIAEYDKNGNMFPPVSFTLMFASDVAIDSSDNTFVLYNNYINIMKLDSQRKKLDSIALPFKTYRIIIDGQNRLCLFDPVSNQINLYSTELKPVGIISGMPSSGKLMGMDHNNNFYFSVAIPGSAGLFTDIVVVNQSGRTLARCSFLTLQTEMRVVGNTVYTLEDDQSQPLQRLRIFSTSF